MRANSRLYTALFLIISCFTNCHAFQKVMPVRLRGSQSSKSAIQRTVKTSSPRTGLKLMVDTDNSIEAIEQVLQLAQAAPAVAGMVYGKAAAASPAALDAATGMGLYYLGQRTKGALSKVQPSWDILARWMVMGTCDGYVSHAWYQFLHSVLAELDLEHWQTAASMTGLTTFFFTPVYCFAFLGGLSMLEGKGFTGARERIEEDYFQLVKATVSTWGLFNCFLFSCVDLEHRVTVAMAAHYVYLIVLALWNEGAFTSDPAQASSSGEEGPASLEEEHSTDMRTLVAVDISPPTEEQLEELMAAGPGLGLTSDMEALDMEGLTEDLQQFAEDLADRVEQAAENVESMAEDLGQNVADQVEQMEGAMEDFGQSVADTVQGAMDDMEQLVEDLGAQGHQSADSEEQEDETTSATEKRPAGRNDSESVRVRERIRNK